WHVRSGEWILGNRRVPWLDPFTFASADRRWVDLHWGFQVAVALAHQLAGVRGIVMLASTVCACTFLTAFGIRKPGWPVMIAGWCWVPALALMSSRFDPRPEIFSLLFMAGFLAVLFRVERSPALIWLLPLLQAVWVNVHSLFVLGPVIVSCYLVDRLVRGFLGTLSGPCGWAWWRHVGPSVPGPGLLSEPLRDSGGSLSGGNLWEDRLAVEPLQGVRGRIHEPFEHGPEAGPARRRGQPVPEGLDLLGADFAVVVSGPGGLEAFPTRSEGAHRVLDGDVARLRRPGRDRHARASRPGRAGLAGAGREIFAALLPRPGRTRRAGDRPALAILGPLADLRRDRHRRLVRLPSWTPLRHGRDSDQGLGTGALADRGQRRSDRHSGRDRRGGQAVPRPSDDRLRTACPDGLPEHEPLRAGWRSRTGLEPGLLVARPARDGRHAAFRLGQSGPRGSDRPALGLAGRHPDRSVLRDDGRTAAFRVG